MDVLWARAWGALAGALDAEDRCRVVNEQTVKFVDSLMDALVFEAKTDD